MSSSQDEREPTAIRKLVGLFHTAREYLNPVLKNSKFKETGVLTPDEFVAAGDFLVYKFPTWQWAGGLKGKQKDYLPKDKQYLITKNVPCLKRVKAMEYHQDVNAADALDDEEGWVATHLDRPARQDTEIEDMEASLEAVQKGIRALMTADLPQDDSPQEIPNLDDIPDIEDEMAEEEDPAALRVSSAVLEPTGASTSRADDDDTRILRTRTYDLSITYDKYYQTPRVFLFGYDEQRNPLSSAQIFQDISQDHAKKTVTIEVHPHEDLTLASIHPCKHANVMKRVIDHLEEAGSELRVDHYLLIFLKFMASVLPTMEYDCERFLFVLH